MKNIGLVHVKSPQVKKELLAVLKDYDFEIIIANTLNEIKREYSSRKDEISLYIQEFDEKNQADSFSRIKLIDRDKTNCILFIHEVSVDLIEEASALNIKDVVKLPFTFEGFRRRIKPLVKLLPTREKEKFADRKESKVIQLNNNESKEKFDFTIARDEMLRSIRGTYPVMFLSLVHSEDLDNSDDRFLSVLKSKLRNTDKVEIYNSSTILIHCPFTPKLNFEIVKNKINEAFREYDENYSSINHMSGIAFPDDLDDIDEVIQTIENQIEDNTLFFQIDNPKYNIDLQALRSKLRRNFL